MGATVNSNAGVAFVAARGPFPENTFAPFVFLGPTIFVISLPTFVKNALDLYLW